MPSKKVLWRSREEVAVEKGLSLPSGELPYLIQKFLRAREVIDSDEIKKMVSAPIGDLKDPSSIHGLDQAVQRIIKAQEANEKICIYADFDLDGTSGLALLYEGLEALGFHNLIYYQPKRLSEGYGFHPHAVEDLSNQGVSLIITVDVGITALEAVQTAKEKNIDVIITDHHQPAETLPVAQVIVNPNLPTDQSGLGYLCGAGVAFYLLRNLKKKLIELNLAKDGDLDLKKSLEFFTIGTLTDMVPLVGDNRILVKHGLIYLEKTERPGFKCLLNSLGLTGRPLTSQDVSIRFAPKLNALSRMEEGILPIHIFLEKDVEQAKLMVTQVLDSNQHRVDHQQSGELEAFEKIKSWTFDKFIFVSSPQFHKGVLGLIATKVAQQMNKPTFVGVEVDGVIMGSARAPNPDWNVLAALTATSGILNRFGGHYSAAGFELNQKYKESFIQGLHEHFEVEGSELRPRIVDYDCNLQLHEVTTSLMRWLDVLGPYGQAFPPPLFAMTDLIVGQVYALKGNHKKLMLFDKDRQNKSEALYFSAPEWIDKTLINQSVRVLVEPQWNYFSGNLNLQLLVREMVIN